MKFCHTARVICVGAHLIAQLGCASILSRSTYPVSIDSTPSRAQFAVKDRKGNLVTKGTTPETVFLPAKDGFFRSGEYQVEFEKNGYVSQTLPLKSSLDEWYFGNILLGGVLGMLVIDPATGAMWELPSEMTTALAEKPISSGGIQQASHSETISDEPAELY